LGKSVLKKRFWVVCQSWSWSCRKKNFRRRENRRGLSGQINEGIGDCGIQRSQRRGLDCWYN
jgi:hypothetical protein